jgi:choice-of-anchor B domain-containing protein
MRKAVLALVILAMAGLSAPAVLAQGFGGAVAVSGTDVIVGETGNSSYPGTIYVFKKQADGTWAESYQMEAPGGAVVGDGFGNALDSNGWHLAVGSARSNSAYVYARNDDGSWGAANALYAADVAEGDAFGSKVVVGDGFVAVAATGQNENAGAVYVFRMNDGGWVLDTKLAPEALKANAVFGMALVAQGDRLIVGAPARVSAFGRRGQEFTEVGSVHVYRRGDDGWAEITQVSPMAVAEGGGFGTAIWADGGKLAVGAPYDNGSVGSVSVYQWSDESAAYAPSTKLAPFVATPGTQFGAFVTIDDYGVFAGAPGANQGSGATYWFSASENGYASAEVSGAKSTSGRAGYGSTIAGAGNVAVVGAPNQDGRAGAAVVWEMDDQGQWIEGGMIVNEMKGLPSFSGDAVDCQDGKAAGFECGNIEITSYMNLKDLGANRGTMVNDIWGWSDEQTGREIAIVGRSDGTSFVDVTNPAMPALLGTLPMTPGARAAAWRDMKVFKDHAYIVADGSGQHGLQVFDLARLRDLDGSNPPVMEPDYLYTDIASAHNIVINEETGIAYSVGGSSGGVTCGGGLHMLDLNKDPKKPEFVGCFADPSTGRSGTGYSHDAQCVTYAGPDTEHAGKEICLGSNETALSIADVTDKDDPVAISMVVYPNVAYAHQGWLSEDHEYFYMNDEGDEPQGLVEGTRTLVWDVRDLDEPVLVTEFIQQTKTTDHNLYIKDNLMYQSNYGSGLRIIDITDRANPVEVGFLVTTQGGGGSWSNYPYFKSGVIAVTDMGAGLFMVRKKNQEM